jgi:drug/metabolite transporter (DMT)-like permease
MYAVSKAVFSVIPPWILLELRFLIGLLVLGAWAKWKGEGKVERKDLLSLAVIGAIGFTGSIGLQFVGTDLSGAAMGSLITSASPALISLFAWWILNERLTVFKGLALLLATAGVLVVSNFQGTTAGNVSLAGNAALFGAAITWALYTVLSRKLTLRYSSLTVTFWANLFGVIFTFPVATWQWSRLHVVLPATPMVWLGVLYIGVVSTALAFYFWNKGFETIDAATGSLFFFFQPIVGSLLGAAFLGEVLPWNFFAGALLIAAGIVLATRRESGRG